MEVSWALIATSSSIDSQTNNISLFNLVDEVGAEPMVEPAVREDGLINLPLSAQLISLWRRSHIGVPESDTLRVVIRTVDGRELFEAQPYIRLDLTEFLRTRAVVNIAGMPVEVIYDHPGEYLFDLETGGPEHWVSRAQVPLVVRMSRPPAPTLVTQAELPLPERTATQAAPTLQAIATPLEN